MIPSRPLFLGDVIGETIRITKVSYWRSVVASFLFLIFPVILLTVGLTGFADEIFHTYQSEGLLTPSSMHNLRIKVIRQLSASNPFFLMMYGIDANEVLSKDTTTINEIPVSKENFSNVFIKHIDDFAVSFIEIGVGIFLLIIAYCGLLATLIDLSSRVFEHRIVSLKKAIFASLQRNMWMLITQWGVYFLSVIIGFGFFIGVGAIISPALAVLCFFASLVLILYSAIRLLPSQAVLVSEEMGPIEAMKQSWSLTAGHFWRFLGYLIALEILLFIINSILSIPFSFISNTDVITHFLNGTELDPVRLFEALKNLILILAVQNFILTILLGIIYPAFVTTMYYDLRTRKEGALEYMDQVII